MGDYADLIDEFEPMLAKPASRERRGKTAAKRQRQVAQHKLRMARIRERVGRVRVTRGHDAR
jgi:hypothetical protein